MTFQSKHGLDRHLTSFLSLDHHHIFCQTAITFGVNSVTSWYLYIIHMTAITGTHTQHRRSCDHPGLTMGS